MITELPENSITVPTPPRMDEEGLHLLSLIDPKSLFIGGAIDVLLEWLKEQASGSDDVSTDEARKEISSRAYSVSRVKTTVEALGKSLVDEQKKEVKLVDAVRKRWRDECDVIKAEARKPLDDYEAAEEARIQAETLALKKDRDESEAHDLNELHDLRKAEEERSKAERERSEAERKAEQAERDRIEAVKRATEEKEKAVADALKQEREAALAKQRERERKEADKEAEYQRQEAEAKRKSENIRHRVAVESHIHYDFCALGLEPGVANRIIDAIKLGQVRHVHIEY